MQPTPLSAIQPARPTLSGKSVLVADDSLTLLRALELRCRGLGLSVETASDGHSTLLKLLKNKPDLLILDLNLPDVDGFKIVERLSDLKFPPLPVIVLTAQSDKAAIQRCDELGVLYVHKDGWEALEKAIFRILGGPNHGVQDQANRAPRVLLVDDLPFVLQWLTSALQNYDLELSSGFQRHAGFLAHTKDPARRGDYGLQHGAGQRPLFAQPYQTHFVDLAYSSCCVQWTIAGARGAAHYPKGPSGGICFQTRRSCHPICRQIGRHVLRKARVP